MTSHRVRARRSTLPGGWTVSARHHSGAQAAAGLSSWCRFRGRQDTICEYRWKRADALLFAGGVTGLVALTNLLYFGTLLDRVFLVLPRQALLGWLRAIGSAVTAWPVSSLTIEIGQDLVFIVRSHRTLVVPTGTSENG